MEVEHDFILVEVSVLERGPESQCIDSSPQIFFFDLALQVRFFQQALELEFGPAINLNTVCLFVQEFREMPIKCVPGIETRCPDE